VTSRDWTCPVYGLDVHGNDLDHVDGVSSWEDCGFICFQRPDCQFWTWITERAEGDQAWMDLDDSRIL
jgi:hypothetical protein